MSQPDEIGVFNPLSSDFSCQFDQKELRVPSREIAYFSPELARHVKKHLYDAIINERQLNGIELNADPQKKKAIMEEMEV